MPSLSFDPMAGVYDATRTYDEASFSAALAYLLARFPPAHYPHVLEPGVGTGRIALPLAERGYKVWGLDISALMLARLRQRAVCASPRLGLVISRADVCHLPFHARRFNLAVAVHLFYFIPNWRQAVQELLRVLRGDGPLVLMHTGMGQEIPSLNERYKELCAMRGMAAQTCGVRSTKEVVDYCRDLGCRIETVHDRWQWKSHLRLETALDYIRTRAYSFTTEVPPHLHKEIVERLEGELLERYGSLTHALVVHNQISLTVVRKP